MQAQSNLMIPKVRDQTMFAFEQAWKNSGLGDMMEDASDPSPPSPSVSSVYSDTRRPHKIENRHGAIMQTVFTKPTVISDAMCQFLGVPKGSRKSRAEVTTLVVKYAREHNLMANHRIKADAPMRKLLSLAEMDNLSILNLQRYLRPHYRKDTTNNV